MSFHRDIPLEEVGTRLYPSYPGWSVVTEAINILRETAELAGANPAEAEAKIQLSWRSDELLQKLTGHYLRVTLAFYRRSVTSGK